MQSQVMKHAWPRQMQKRDPREARCILEYTGITLITFAGLVLWDLSLALASASQCTAPHGCATTCGATASGTCATSRGRGEHLWYAARPAAGRRRCIIFNAQATMQRRLKASHQDQDLDQGRPQGGRRSRGKCQGALACGAAGLGVCRATITWRARAHVPAPRAAAVCPQAQVRFQIEMHYPVEA